MRKIVTLISACFVLLCSCHQERYDSRLTTIDSLLNCESLDSALSLLQQVDTTNLPERNMAYFHLLNTFALYKNYEKPIDETAINHSIRYFSENEQTELLARAYMYKAYILADIDSLEAATTNIKKSEQLLSEVDNLELKMRVYSVLSTLNSITGNYHKAFSYAREILRDAHAVGNKRWIAHGYKDLSFIYSHTNMPDSSDYYLEKMIPYIPYAPRKEQPVYLNNLAFYYMRHQKYEQAESCYVKSLSIRENDYAIGGLADLMTKSNRLAEAREQWKIALNTDDKLLQTSFMQPYADWLYKIGDKDEAWQLAMKIPFVKDSIRYAQQTELIKESQERHDRLVKELHYRQMLERGGYVIVFILMCLVLLWLYYHLKSQRQKRMLAENQALISDYTLRIGKMIADGKDQSKEVKELQRKMEELRAQQGHILSRGKKLYEDIIGGGTTVKWHKKEFADFMEYYRMNNLSFVRELETEYNSLTPMNMFFLSLYEMGYKDEEVMSIMGLSDSSVRSNKSRLHSKRRSSTQP